MKRSVVNSLLGASLLALAPESTSAQQTFIQVTDAPGESFLQAHPEQEPVRNFFGKVEEVLVHDVEAGLFEKNIYLDENNHFYYDYRQQTQHLEQMTSFLKNESEFMSLREDYPTTCHSNRHQSSNPDDNFMFAPAWTGQLSMESPKIEFEGNCFESISMEMKYEEGSDQVQVLVETRKPRSLTCNDFFLIANTEVYHVENFFFRGTHKLNFKLPSNLDREGMKFFGLETYLFCEHLKDELLSVFNTVKSFVGGLGINGKVPLFQPKVPEYMEKANVEFLKWAVNVDLQERPTRKVVIDEDLIQSGDYFAIMRLDGLDPMIMYGTGSRSGHSVMALRFDGELYIVESQDAWYWPVHRIQRNKFSEWIRYAEDCDFNVVWMPLSEESRAKFNETAAQEFFFRTEGLPYGYHSFIYSWVDTVEDNYPRLVPKDLVPVVFSMIERFDRNVTDTIFTDSLNFKLGTKGLNISEVAVEAGRQGMNVSEVMAIVEQDGWKYEGFYHDGEAYVCSSYVAALWKAAGLFDDLEINAVEWSPKDVYQVDFYNKSFERPQACVEADPDSQFCQLLGKYRMEFPGFSEIKPYAHMNEKCPSIAPEFVRTEGC